MNIKTWFFRGFRALYKPLFLLVYRPRIIGSHNIPGTGGAVIAGNHKHALDPILINISTKRVVRTLAKKELHDGRLGFLFRLGRTIPVDLQADKNTNALNAAVEALKEGDLVNVSPEAKRNYTDELLLPFKYGAAAMSDRADVPIIPYAITGEYKIFTKDRLTVVFSKPVRAQGGDLYRANKQLYSRVAALMKRSLSSEELSKKHYTTFDEWSSNNEKTS